MPPRPRPAAAGRTGLLSLLCGGLLLLFLGGCNTTPSSDNREVLPGIWGTDVDGSGAALLTVSNADSSEFTRPCDSGVVRARLVSDSKGLFSAPGVFYRAIGPAPAQGIPVRYSGRVQGAFLFIQALSTSDNTTVAGPYVLHYGRRPVMSGVPCPL